ncbi:MAG: hypothetical protein NXI30_23410 [bacterium]|nr:hypothetical protein [bacterium]
MRIVQIVSLAVVAVGLVVLLSAPIGPLPGVFIGGTDTPPPATWPDTSGVDEIRLKAPGAIPRVVIIWVIDVAGELYVVGMKESGWTRRIGDGAPVEVRIGDATYAIEARLVEEGGEAILTAYAAKYEPNYPDIVAGLPSMQDAPEVASIYRLDRG